MVREGATPERWLRSITQDQNLTKLSDLSRVQYDTLRNMFLSALIQPTVDFSHIRTNTESTVSTTSVGTYTMTVPAGRVRKLLWISGINDTRAPTWQAYFTPAGGAASIFIESATAWVQAATAGLFGTGQTTAFAIGGPPVTPWILQEGDSITVTNVNFVAGDVMNYTFVYEEYEVL